MGYSSAKMLVFGFNGNILLRCGGIMELFCGKKSWHSFCFGIKHVCLNYSDKNSNNLDTKTNMDKMWKQRGYDNMIDMMIGYSTNPQLFGW